MNRADTGTPIGGQTIVFLTRNPKTGSQDTVCTAVTKTSGAATCTGTIPVADKLSDTSYTASYSGNANYKPTFAAGKLS